MNSGDETGEDSVENGPDGKKARQEQNGFVTKRRILAGVGIMVLLVVLLLLVLVPNSLLGLVVSSSASFEAEPVIVPDDALTESEYEHSGENEIVVEEDISIVGQERSIIATSYLNSYENSLAVQGVDFDSATLTLVSTPAIELFGNPANPVADMEHKEILMEFQDDFEGEYSELGDLEKVEERDGVLAGHSTTISVFESTVSVEGAAVDIYLHVATVESEDDILIGVGGHPAAFSQERVTIYELMEDAEHPI